MNRRQGVCTINIQSLLQAPEYICSTYQNRTPKSLRKIKRSERHRYGKINCLLRTKVAQFTNISHNHCEKCTVQSSATGGSFWLHLNDLLWDNHHFHYLTFTHFLCHLFNLTFRIQSWYHVWPVFWGLRSTTTFSWRSLFVASDEWRETTLCRRRASTSSTSAN